MEVRATVGRIVQIARDRDISFLAAGFAYYAFVSMIPLALFAVVLGSLFGDESTAEQLLGQVGDYLPAAGEEMIVETLTTETGRIEATLVALVFATWGSLRVFRGLSRAFNTIYGDQGNTSIVHELLEGFAVILGIGGAILLMVATGVVIGLLPDAVPAAGLLGWAVLIVGLIVAFLPMYVVLPPVRVHPPEALPGAAVATAGWVALQWGFQLYAANAAQYEAYGVIGAVLLFVTWLYFAGLFIMLGAVVNVVLGRPELAR